MATNEALTSITRPAAADLSASQYLFVALDSNGDVDVAGAGADAAGVLQNDPDVGQAAQVGINGVSKVVAGEAVAAGAKLAADAAGKAVAASGTGTHVLGTAVTAAGAADEVIEVLLVSKHVLA